MSTTFDPYKTMWPVFALLIGALLSFCLVVVVAAWLRYRVFGRAGTRRTSLSPDCPFRCTKSLLSPREMTFYDTLRQALAIAAPANQWMIFPKVRLLDLLWLPGRTPQRQAHLNTVMSKHVDFTICDASDLRPLLVIELDDETHERWDRQERDAGVDAIFDAVGLPIIHEPTQQRYDAQKLARRIRQQIANGASAK